MELDSTGEANIVHGTGEFIGASDVSIFFQSWLPEPGVRRGIVVLVHGLGEHSGRYANLVGRLTAEGYGIYALDHQGFGRSGGPRGHVAQFVDYLHDVLRVVRLAKREHPDCPLVLYGHSMGGLINLYFAMDYGEELDYLIASAPALKGNPNPILVCLMRLMNKIKPTFSMRRPGTGIGITRDPDELHRFETDPLRVPVSSARWTVEILTNQTLIAGRAEEITVPLLMLQGSADTLVVPEATISFFEHVSSEDKTLHLYEGFFHELHNELDRQEPLDDIVEWLNQRIPARQ